MTNLIIFCFIIGFSVFTNCANIPQPKDKTDLTDPDHEIEIVDHLKTGEININQQLSALFQDNDENPSGGGGGRSFWSWFRGIFGGSGGESGKDPDDILPFGWGNDLVDALNTLLGRVNTILKVNVVLQPKPLPNQLRKNAVLKKS